MALLIDVGQPDWLSNDALRADLLALAPDQDIRVADHMGDPKEIRMLAASRLRPDLPAQLPNLELVQKLGAGVETIVAHPALGPKVRVARLRPDAPAREIAEFCLAYILREQRNMRAHDAAQTRRDWAPIAPRVTENTAVGVLGLGHIGGRTARLLRDIGFQVSGWSQSQKRIDGITCLYGPEGLARILTQSDHIAAILPSTAHTRGLLNAHRLAQMKSHATLINAGRGDLIVEPDLIAALNAAPDRHAVLDVLSTEPLPADSPLWGHPQITITPHVSGWHLGDALKDVAENHRRLLAGAPLLHEVNRLKGY